MKTVFENSMVAHVWAAQSQASARSANGNFYFSGRELFSYGSHFIVGLIMPGNVALLNSASYSKSTGKQQGYAWRAVRHMTTHSVPGLTDIAYALKECDGAKTETLVAAKVRKYVADNIQSMTENAAEYLLSITGTKNAARVAAKLLADAKRKAEKAKAKDAAETKRGHLAYASRVSVLVKTEKNLVAGLANVLNPEHRLKAYDTAKELHHAHRAAKAAKRDRQAADCLRVLKLVRAEIAHRERQAAVKNANQFARSNIRAVRDGLQLLQLATVNGQTVGSYDANMLARAAGDVARLVRAKRARASLDRLKEGLDETRDAVRAAEIAAEEKKRAAEIAKQARALQDWRDAVPGARAPYRYNGAAMLRAVNVTRDDSGAITGGTLETSQGANVPLTHAVRAFRFIKLCREHGRAWHANGHSVRVGHFRVDSIEPNGNMVAGCHRIEWQETERLALALGIFESAADDSALEETHAAA